MASNCFAKWLDNKLLLTCYLLMKCQWFIIQFTKVDKIHLNAVVILTFSSHQIVSIRMPLKLHVFRTCGTAAK